MLYTVRFHLPSGSTFDVELDGNKKLGRHFAVWELANKNANETVKLELWPESLEFIKILDELRDELGPITVNSGYRTVSYNKKVGGDPRSAHLRTCAIDLPRAYEYPLFRDTFKRICKEHNVKAAMNLYSSYYHIEIYSDKWYGQTNSFVVRNKT